MIRICILTSFDFAVGWAWTDKTSLGFTNWAPNEPNFAFHPGDVAEENCVEMYHDGHWNDNNCLEKRGFVCRHRQCKDFFYYCFINIRMWKTEFPQLFHCGFKKINGWLKAFVWNCLSDYTTDDGGNPIIPTDGPDVNGNSKCGQVYSFECLIQCAAVPTVLLACLHVTTS